MPKILIADDNEQVLKQLSSILSTVENWNVCGQAANGRQALLMAHQLKPDLIILDVAMPMLDGLHAAVEILKFAPDVPIVLYTLYKNDQIELEGKKVGARKVLSKTEPIDDLIKTIHELLTPPPALRIPSQEELADVRNQPSVRTEAETPKILDSAIEPGEGT